LEKCFDFDSSPFKNFSILSLKQDMTSEGLTNIVEANGLTIDKDELYSEHIVFRSVSEELSKEDVRTDQKWQSQCSKFAENCEDCFVCSCKQCCSRTCILNNDKPVDRRAK
jgi:hypothetical protein